MRKNRLLLILFAVILGAVLLFGAALRLSSRQHHVAVLSAPPSGDTLCDQSISAEWASLSLRVTREDTLPAAPGRYRLTAELRNETQAQYEYSVSLGGLSASLLNHSDQTELTYGENYSAGGRNNGKTVFHFVPREKRCSAAEAGSLSFLLTENDHAASGGTAEITVTVYSPFLRRACASMTHQISFSFPPG